VKKFRARYLNFQDHVRLDGIDETLLDISTAWTQHLEIENEVARYVGR